MLEIHSTRNPQSDIESECSSEIGDDMSIQDINIDVFSKEQLFYKVKKVLTQLTKYRGRYSEVTHAYKILEGEREKMKKALSDFQDNSIRKLNEMKETITVNQQAKLEMEILYRQQLAVKDDELQALNLKMNQMADGLDKSINLHQELNQQSNSQEIIDGLESEINELKEKFIFLQNEYVQKVNEVDDLKLNFSTNERDVCGDIYARNSRLSLPIQTEGGFKRERLLEDKDTLESIVKEQSRDIENLKRAIEAKDIEIKSIDVINRQMFEELNFHLKAIKESGKLDSQKWEPIETGEDDVDIVQILPHHLETKIKQIMKLNTEMFDHLVQKESQISASARNEEPNISNAQQSLQDQNIRQLSHNLEYTLDPLKQKINEMDMNLSSTSANVKNMITVMAKRMENLNSTRLENEKLSKINLAFEEKVNQLTARNNRQMGEIERLNAEIFRLKEEISAKENECSELKNELKFKDDTIGKLDLEMEIKNEECLVLNLKLKTLSDERNKLEDNRIESVSQIENLNSEMSLKDSQIFTLQNETKNLKKEIKNLLKNLQTFEENDKKILNKLNCMDQAIQTDREIPTPETITINMEDLETLSNKIRDLETKLLAKEEEAQKTQNLLSTISGEKESIRSPRDASSTFINDFENWEPMSATPTTSTKSMIPPSEYNNKEREDVLAILHESDQQMKQTIDDYDNKLEDREKEIVDLKNRIRLKSEQLRNLGSKIGFYCEQNFRSAMHQLSSALLATLKNKGFTQSQEEEKIINDIWPQDIEKYLWTGPITHIINDVLNDKFFETSQSSSTKRHSSFNNRGAHSKSNVITDEYGRQMGENIIQNFTFSDSQGKPDSLHAETGKYYFDDLYNSFPTTPLTPFYDVRMRSPSVASTNVSNQSTSVNLDPPPLFPETSELEYLRKIIYEYIMGNEPLTMVKVISAVLKFPDDKKHRIIERERIKTPQKWH